jgi:hypothetical protein
MNNIIICLLIIIGNIFATQVDYGIKPLSLGSVYSASYGDLYSLYSNPAGLHNGGIFDLRTDFILGVNFTGDILYNVNQIIDTAEKFEKIRNAQQSGGTLDVTQVASFFKGIKNLVDINKPGKGMLTQVNGGLGFKIKNFAFSVRNVTNIGLKPRIDTGFSLSTNTISSTQSTISKSLKFSETNNNEGIYITTDTLKYPGLEQTRDELKESVNWIIDTLEKFGVSVPPEVKDNTEGIANALINLAKDNGAKDEEIKDAVTQLKDEDMRYLIENFVNNMLNNSSSFTNNNSGLVLKGVNYTEIALGYSYEIIKDLFVGTSLKYLIGKTIYYDFKIFQEKDAIDFNDITDIQNKLVRTSHAIGIDLGTMYKLPIPVPLIETSAGIVIKNLVEPEFAIVSTEDKLKLSRQVSVALAGKLYKILYLNIGCDLNKAHTFVEGYDIQNFALGLEINPPFLPSVRMGYIKNLAYEKDQIYTFGLGFKILVVNIDIGCALNPQEVKISKDFTFFANNFNLGLSLGVTF